MKRSHVLALLGLVNVAIMASVAVAQIPSRPVLLQDAATATGVGTTAHVSGYAMVGVQVVVPTGASPVFSVQFEESLNGTHFSAVLCHPHNGTALTSNAAAAGIWRCNVSGATLFRARVASYTGPGSVSAFGLMLAGGTLHAASLRSPVEVASR